MFGAYHVTYTGEDKSAREQFINLAGILTGEIIIPLHYAEPARPRIGRMVVADGTEWDPISAGAPAIVWYNGTAWAAV
jgi:hypothetical protein